jgi:hypothetical protein
MKELDALPDKAL